MDKGVMDWTHVVGIPREAKVSRKNVLEMANVVVLLLVRSEKRVNESVSQSVRMQRTGDGWGEMRLRANQRAGGRLRRSIRYLLATHRQ